MHNTTHSVSRRILLTGIAAAPALAVAPSPMIARAEDIDAAAARAKAALKDANGTKLVLLGTGSGPIPGLARRMASNLMVHNGAAYVLDCGLGATNEYARTGIAFSALRSIFITHHHPDHSIEYGPLLIIGWISGMRQSVRAYGPPPLAQMTEDYFRSAKATIDFWAQDFRISPLRAIEVQEIQNSGPVMQDDNVKVTSVVVQHPPVTPALGYRFDFPDRSIAFSGDTTALEAVAQMAKGADVLVHEAMDFPAIEVYVRQQLAAAGPGVGSLDAAMAHMRADHTSAEDAGRIAQEAGVKTLVLSHIGPPFVSDASWQAAAGKFFKGEIIVGHDLAVI
jgi:ribonuclease BN (tRNA processing enzyme)